MNRYYILDENKEPIPVDALEWATWYETAERHVGDTTIGDARISTVFLGLDHSFGHGKPLIYETMVFGGALDQECRRYSTRQEALDGHAEMVKRVSEDDPNPSLPTPYRG